MKLAAEVTAPTRGCQERIVVFRDRARNLDSVIREDQVRPSDTGRCSSSGRGRPENSSPPTSGRFLVRDCAIIMTSSSAGTPGGGVPVVVRRAPEKPCALALPGYPTADSKQSNVRSALTEPARAYGSTLRGSRGARESRNPVSLPSGLQVDPESFAIMGGRCHADRLGVPRVGLRTSPR